MPAREVVDPQYRFAALLADRQGLGGQHGLLNELAPDPGTRSAGREFIDVHVRGGAGSHLAGRDFVPGRKHRW